MSTTIRPRRRLSSLIERREKRGQRWSQSNAADTEDTEGNNDNDDDDDDNDDNNHNDADTVKTITDVFLGVETFLKNDVDRLWWLTGGFRIKKAQV